MIFDWTWAICPSQVIRAHTAGHAHAGCGCAQGWQGVARERVVIWSVLRRLRLSFAVDGNSSVCSSICSSAWHEGKSSSRSLTGSASSTCGTPIGAACARDEVTDATVSTLSNIRRSIAAYALGGRMGFQHASCFAVQLSPGGSGPASSCTERNRRERRGCMRFMEELSTRIYSHRYGGMRVPSMESHTEVIAPPPLQEKTPPKPYLSCHARRQSAYDFAPNDACPRRQRSCDD